MFTLLLFRVTLALLIGVVALATLDRAVPASPPLLITADFPVCVTVVPPPLGPRVTGKNRFPRRNDTA